MGRYTGPVERLSRREGVELYLKGERALNQQQFEADVRPALQQNAPWVTLLSASN